MEARLQTSAPVPSAASQDDGPRGRAIDTIRCLAMDAVQKANAGHPGTAMALAPLAYTIYMGFLRADPAETQWPDRDRFVLSCGHACVLQYSLLHLTGYDLGLEDLRQFRQWGSRTPGHPERGHTPGIEVTTGPLGQGMANAVGMAMAERFLGDRFNRPGHAVVDHRVYAVCSDGDMMEGISQEAASIAGNFALGKLIVCYDDNHITIDGTTSLSFDGEDHAARLRADGWHVQSVADSEDLDALRGALSAAREEGERPSFISIRSHIAYPAPRAVDTAKSHGAPLGEDEVRATKEVMGFDPDSTFAVSEEVYEHMSLRERGAAVREQWAARFAAWREAFPQAAEDWDRAWAGRLRDGWREVLPRFAGGEEIATRAAGQKTMAAFAEFGPTMIGGAADLVASTRTVFDGAGEFSRAHAGRNVPFGIREHAMGAIVNGAAAHGGIVKPYGSTFLDFLRLHARSGAPVGADGAAGPVGLDARLRRPRRGRADAPADRALRGAARDPAPVGHPPGGRQRDGGRLAGRARARGRPRRAAALAPGHAGARRARARARPGAQKGRLRAVGLRRVGQRRRAVGPSGPDHDLDRHRGRADARRRHGTSSAQGTRVRVVSMPCVELFEAQSPQYREQVLPRAATARLAVEPGATISWWKWVGSDGDVLGLDRFGASAPGKTVLTQLGFSADGIAARARALIEGKPNVS